MSKDSDILEDLVQYQSQEKTKDWNFLTISQVIPAAYRYQNTETKTMENG